MPAFFHTPTPSLQRHALRPARPAPLFALVLTVLVAPALPGCQRGADAPVAPGPAEAAFGAIATACTQAMAARGPSVRTDGAGAWVQVGYSPALVQHEVVRTDSPITPYVGKIVIKDNLAQATAPTEAAARAITLTPAHLVSNRTHTFIYSFDGTRWHWQNGQRLTKTPGQEDRTQPLALADVTDGGTGGFAPCLPH